jgi:hypothetical protein
MGFHDLPVFKPARGRLDACPVSAAEVPAEANGFGPLAALRRDFPGWHPWRSSAGRYWASRVAHRRKPDGLPIDASVTWAMTVDGDTAAQLRKAIEAQESHSPP